MKTGSFVDPSASRGGCIVASIVVGTLMGLVVSFFLIGIFDSIEQFVMSLWKSGTAGTITLVVIECLFIAIWSWLFFGVCKNDITKCDHCGKPFAILYKGSKYLTQNSTSETKTDNNGKTVTNHYLVGRKKIFYKCKFCGHDYEWECRYKERV